MGQYLIVANQTLGGAKLDRAIREHIERGETRFYIVVPMTPPEHEAPSWSGGFALGRSMSHPYVVAPNEGVSPEQAAREMEEAARRREARLDEARRRADDRLGQMIDKIRSAGGEAEGEVGDTDPAAAVERVLNDRSFDGIIVSTLPAGISRWLKMDLSSRVARMTDAPVTTVEAEA
jgi:hypothetical protein